MNLKDLNKQNLIEQLKKSEKEIERFSAAWRLGVIKAEEAEDALIQAVSTEKKSSNRKIAVWALGQLCKEKSLDIIDLILRHDVNYEVKIEAIYALMKYGGKSIPYFLKILRKETKVLYDNESIFPFIIINNFQDMGSDAESAVPEMVNFYWDKKATSELKQNIIHSFQDIHTENVIPALIKILHEDENNDNRLKAAFVIGNVKLRINDSVKALIKTLEMESDMSVKHEALISLSKLGAEGNFILVKHLLEDYRNKKNSLVINLGVEAIEYLIPLLIDKDESIKRMARINIFRLQNKAIEPLIYELRRSKTLIEKYEIAKFLKILNAKEAINAIKEVLIEDIPNNYRFNFSLILVHLENGFGEGSKIIESMKSELNEKQLWLYEECLFDNYYTSKNAIISETKKLPPIKIFISYSWDNKSHSDWVEKFAEKLIQKGFEILFDKWDIKLGEYITEFMDKIAEADYILMIFTEGYIEKLKKEIGGVKYEERLIKYLIFNEDKKTSIIPILKGQNIRKKIPPSFSLKKYLDMSNDEEFEEKFKELLDHFKKTSKRR